MRAEKEHTVSLTPIPRDLRFVSALTSIALFVQIAGVHVHADQSGGAGAQVTADGTTAENMQVSFAGGVVTITYDLTASERQGSFNVTLDVSTNGGQTYDVQARAISGDVGQQISAGRAKRILWEFARDVESLQTSQFRFRVTIRVETLFDAGAPAPQQPQTPAVPVTPPNAPTLGRQASGGNRLLWPGLAMLGAGGALAGVAGAGPLRTKNDYIGFYELAPNKPAMYGGIGVAATGLVLLLLGRGGTSNTVLVVPLPGGVMLYRATTF
jgi:hypothetical protein